MTTFFNKKEEVLQVKLTQYGKHKLSQGRLNPTFYSFFDEGVVYDSQYIGYGEAQNDTEARIQTDTPSLKSQHVYTGIQTSASLNASIVRGAFQSAMPSLAYYENDPYFLEELQPHDDKNGFLTKPLGTSALIDKHVPAWRVSPLIGEICDSERNLSASDGIKKIPQINLTVNYETFIAQLDPTEDLDDIADLDPTIYPDGTYYVVRENDILLAVEEKNAPFNKENFDIEIFEVNEHESQPRQLRFSVQEDAETLQVVFPELTKNNVEYYLQINLDSEISDSMRREANIVDISSPVVSDEEIGVSTRRYLIRDLYEPEEDICE
tara:strand:- start:24632 stop:25600 length:969 start_codon:yes stop_codon:yes gene_type:complete